MNPALLALFIAVMRHGVAAQEECARVAQPEVETGNALGHDDLGLVMLQVSKEALSVKAKEGVTEKYADASESDAKNTQAAAAASEQHSQAKHNERKGDAMDKLSADHIAEQKKAAHTTQQNLTQEEQKVAPITMGSCFSSEYGLIVGFLLALIVGLVVGLHFQYKTNLKLSAKIRGLRAKLRADKYLLKADERKLRTEKELLREEQRRLLAIVHDRGNIFFDADLRQIVLKRTIPFEPVVRVEGMSLWYPFARYADDKAALMTLSDVAEVCEILPFACFLIEGHTLQSGSLDEIDEFAHEVADARAMKVKDTLLAFGVPPDRLEALGLPGALGNNRAEVLLKLVN